ncbi:hypothetical protein [Neorhizobium sp. T7_12]|uniref:hypothetical protein n=1 Tax=Neorhizobium sp. T7_12 TaxID=2093832 RepID=UPI000CF8A723|nr:hypothetical protein [Neorhizobium sp. T7_12]
MLNFRKIAVFFLAVMWAGSGYAQDYCGDVLRYAAKDYSLETQQDSIAKDIYDQTCTGSQAKDTKSFSLGAEAVIYSVPAKFNLGSGSTKDRVEHFCRTFDSDYRANTARYRETSLVSKEAVSAWSNCVQLSGEGVKFKPLITTTQVTIEIKKTAPDAVEVAGIQFDPSLLACSVPNDNNQATRVDATMKTVKTLNSGGTWQVSCDRKSRSDDHQQTYREADLSVHTSKGSFTVRVPADAAIGPQSASEINEKLRLVQAGLQQQAAKIPELQCDLVSVDSGPFTRFPTAEAKIPAGYQLMGGGCDLSGAEPGQAGGRAHNGPITASRPNSSRDGWYCKAMDPPGVPLAYSVRAWAVYCRAQMR